MSFILNALRKSEKEKQPLQPENLRDMIQERSINTKKKNTLWLIILFLINLVLLFYFIWLFALKVETNINNEKPAEITKTEKTINHTRAINPASIENSRKKEDIQHTVNIESILGDTSTKAKKNEPQISIKQMVENKKLKQTE